jgi:hypothetical protein
VASQTHRGCQSQLRVVRDRAAFGTSPVLVRLLLSCNYRGVYNRQRTYRRGPGFRQCEPLAEQLGAPAYRINFVGRLFRGSDCGAAS